MTSHYVHIQWSMMPIFNPVKDLDPSDTYTKKVEIQWKQFKLSSGHQAHMNEHPPRFIKKSVKKSGKIQILKSSKTRELYHVSPSGLFKYQD